VAGAIKQIGTVDQPDGRRNRIQLAFKYTYRVTIDFQRCDLTSVTQPREHPTIAGDADPYIGVAVRSERESVNDVGEATRFSQTEAFSGGVENFQSTARSRRMAGFLYPLPAHLSMVTTAMARCGKRSRCQLSKVFGSGGT